MKKRTMVKDEDFSKMEKIYSDRKKYVDRGKYFYFSYGVRLFLMVLSIAIIASISYICFAVSFSEGKDVFMKYKKSANVEHSVTWIEDSLYSQGIITPGDSYLSEELDKISSDITYALSLDEKSTVKYTYEVKERIEIRNRKDGKIISNNIKPLIPEQTGTIEDTKVLDLHQNINTDYHDYNNKAKRAMEDYTAVDANVYLQMEVKVEVTNSKISETFKTSDVIEVKIPLMSTNVTVSMVDSIDKEDMYIEHTKSELINEASLFVGIILFILDTIFVLITISFIVKTTPKKSKYVRLRNGLLRSYGNVIVNTKNIPEFEGYNVISCYSFSELMDAQKLLKKPILYKEIVKDRKCIFVVVSDNDLYEFVLKEADIEY